MKGLFSVLLLIVLNCHLANALDSKPMTAEAKSEASHELDLVRLLQKSLSEKDKSQEIEADLNLEWLGFIPGVSPWLTEMNTSVENLWSSAENGGLETDYRALNLSTTVNQRTPFGLGLNVSFEKLLNVPDVNTFLFKERISGNIFLSLYNDFLGFNSKEILTAIESKNKKVFDDKVRLQTCERISNQFFDTFLNEQNYLINKESIKDIEFIQKRLTPNAISRQDYLSLSIDKAQLQNRIAKSEQMFKASQLSLSDLSRIEVKDLNKLTLNESVDEQIKSMNQKFQIIDRLDIEIDILKARKKLIDINQRNDISFYAGLRSQQTLPLNDTTTSNVVGLNVSWNFGNMQIENSKQTIDFEISKRNIQKDHILNQQKDILANFTSALNEQSQALNLMKTARRNAEELQTIAQKNFLNGRTSFFEFLTLRNQVNSIKTEHTQALIDIYKTVLNQSVYLGDTDKACFVTSSKVGLL